MDYQEKAKRVIQLEIEELTRLTGRIDANFGQAVEALKSALENRCKILVVGVGKSGNIGEKLAATLNSTGSTTAALNCQNALHGDLGLVDEGDAILALSYSGETSELIDLLPHLRRLHVTIIAITGRPDSTLGRNSDIVLDVNVTREACPLNLAPTSSTTNMLVMGDALAMVLLEARGFRKEDFAVLHPGGSLGRALLTKTRDIMRAGDAFVAVDPEENVRSVLEKMTKARAGAVVVTGGDGGLLGIFTQGDFTRAFQTQADVGIAVVGDLMTKNPITIAEEKLAAEALKILEDHRIDDLVVVNDMNQPVGVIDIQDLTRMHIL